MYIPQLFLNQSTLVNYSDIHQDAALLNSINYPNSKRGHFYIREQNKVSFTARLTSLISNNTKLGLTLSWNTLKLQWYLQPWRDYFQFFDKRMASATKAASNKTAMLTEAKERWKLFFCIVLYLLELFDSLPLEDYYGLKCVGDVACKKSWRNSTCI